MYLNFSDGGCGCGGGGHSDPDVEVRGPCLGAPGSSIHVSPTCSQPGGHRRHFPTVLRALHRAPLSAARLGAGRLHVQIRQLHPAGTRAAAPGAGEMGRREGWGAGSGVGGGKLD